MTKKHEDSVDPGGSWLSNSPLDPRFVGSNWPGSMVFSERKNPEFDFLWKGCKTMGPMS